MGKALRSYAEWRRNENLREYDFYFRKFRKLITSMFKWENLPDGISARFIEDKLFFNGKLIFFKSQKLGFYVVSQCAEIGLNDYEEPTGYRAYGVNMINEPVLAKDCVPIWNDLFRQGNAQNVHFFSKRLSNIEKTIDINLEQLKNPFIISCPEGQRETVKQVMKQKTEGVPYIFTSDEFSSMVDVRVFDLNIKNHTRELEEVKHSIENEGLTFFGINNVNVLKRERLVTGEAEQNDEQITFNKQSMLMARQQAVEQINGKFNQNIKVSLNNYIAEEVEKIKEGVQDE